MHDGIFQILRHMQPLDCLDDFCGVEEFVLGASQDRFRGATLSCFRGDGGGGLGIDWFHDGLSARVANGIQIAMDVFGTFFPCIRKSEAGGRLRFHCILCQRKYP